MDLESGDMSTSMIGTLINTYPHINKTLLWLRLQQCISEHFDIPEEEIGLVDKLPHFFDGDTHYEFTVLLEGRLQKINVYQTWLY